VTGRKAMLNVITGALILVILLVGADATGLIEHGH